MGLSCTVGVAGKSCWAPDLGHDSNSRGRRASSTTTPRGSRLTHYPRTEDMHAYIANSGDDPRASMDAFSPHQCPPRFTRAAFWQWRRTRRGQKTWASPGLEPGSSTVVITTGQPKLIEPEALIVPLDQEAFDENFGFRTGYILSRSRDPNVYLERICMHRVLAGCHSSALKALRGRWR